jgi:hypothetical protein
MPALICGTKSTWALMVITSEEEDMGPLDLGN